MENSLKEELFKRHDTSDTLKHLGKKDPNLIIYNSFLEMGNEAKAKRFLEYREKWENSIKNQKKAPYPLSVTLAFNYSCNYLCAHCYRRVNKDRNQHHDSFSLEECKSMLKKLKEAGTHAIILGADGEVTLYKHIKEMLKYIGKLDFEDVFFYTNGSLLTDEITDLILENRITRVMLSIDAIKPNTYKKVRSKKHYYRVLSNIFNFLDKREKLKSKLPILRVSFIEYNLNTDDKKTFIDFWREIADEVDVQHLLDVRNINELKYSEIDEELIKCNYPFCSMYIQWDGIVRPCCSEFSMKSPRVGNIKRMSVNEVWNSSAMEDIRKQLLKQKPLNKICINCLRSHYSKEKYDPIE